MLAIFLLSTYQSAGGFSSAFLRPKRPFICLWRSPSRKFIRLLRDITFIDCPFSSHTKKRWAFAYTYSIDLHPMKHGDLALEFLFSFFTLLSFLYHLGMNKRGTRDSRESSFSNMLENPLAGGKLNVWTILQDL